jgi:hypothetical protein
MVMDVRSTDMMGRRGDSQPSGVNTLRDGALRNKTIHRKDNPNRFLSTANRDTSIWRELDIVNEGIKMGCGQRDKRLEPR